MNELKHLLRHHDILFTVPAMAKELYEEFEKLGYKMGEKPFLGQFNYFLEDGSIVEVYWENGNFYEEIK